MKVLVNLRNLSIYHGFVICVFCVIIKYANHANIKERNKTRKLEIAIKLIKHASCIFYEFSYLFYIY